MTHQVSVLPNNDSGCSWVNTLPPRQRPIESLKGEQRAKWVVLGAGYTGLAAARRLAEHFPDETIVLLDGQRAGEGGTGRNSGFAVDISPSPNPVSDPEAAYRRGYRLNIGGLKELKRLVELHNIDCDWDESSAKFHCAAEAKHETKLRTFQSHLQSLGLGEEWFEHERLTERLGTKHYHCAVRTTEGVLVQPAALARGLLEHLPSNVQLWENSPVTRIDYGAPHTLHCPHGTLRCDNIILATNAYLPHSGQVNNRVMSLTLTASMTRPLTPRERDCLGNPSPWGILSAHKLGATLRYTNDHRLLIRNTAEYWPNMSMSADALKSRVQLHRERFDKRFPSLAHVPFEDSWSGVICMSSNFASVFGEIQKGVYASGCYNASGISRGSMLGTLMGDYIAGAQSDLLSDVLSAPKPNFIPPRPFLDLGARADLLRRRIGRGQEY